MRRTLFATGLSLAMLGASAMHSTAALADPVTVVPDPAQFKVQIVSLAGTGCPAGTAAVNVTPENSWFTVTYDVFEAEIGPKKTKSDARKACQLGIDVDVPPGYTFTIANIEHRGAANLADGATAYVRGIYYWSGERETKVVSNDLAGPYDKNWQFSDEVELEAVSEKPCGEPKTFNSKLDVGVRPGKSDPKSESVVTLDSTDVKFSTEFQLIWKKC